jgi:hypothetical protein
MHTTRRTDTKQSKDNLATQMKSIDVEEWATSLPAGW